MLSSLNKLFIILPSNRKQHLLFLFLLSVIASFFELLGIGAIIPFLTIIVSPDSTLDNMMLRNIINFVGIDESKFTLSNITVFFALSVLASAVIRVLQLTLQLTVAHGIARDIGYKIFENSLTYKLKQDRMFSSSDIMSLITIKSNMLAEQVIVPLVVGASSLIMLSAIVIFLTTLNTAAAFSGFILFAVLYGVTLVIVNKKIKFYSEEISIKSDQIVKTISESHNLIIETELGNKHDYFKSRYRLADAPYRRAKALISSFGGAPRYLIEAIALLVFVLLTIVLSLSSSSDLSASIPILGAFAIAAQKILPLFQQQYHSWSAISGAADIINDIDNFLTHYSYKSRPLIDEELDINDIELENVTVEKDNFLILNDINLKIKRGQTVGIVGRTGSGKTTLIEVITGLQSITKGNLLVNNQKLDDWTKGVYQFQIAYVTQDVHLINDTVIANIAFGVPEQLVNKQIIDDVCKKAEVFDDILKFPNGFRTVIGDGGLKISGGQKQRIGIARALYRRPKVLIFDESTNSLDKQTEKDVLDTLCALKKEMINIIISHNLETMNDFDKIYRIHEKGLYLDKR